MLNPFFTSANNTVQGESSEQDFFEDMIIEAIQIYGVEMFYIPRTLIAKDEILGEDRLSQFNKAYPIECYMESVAGFEGQGAFLDKFGLYMEQSATMTMSRKRWSELIGRHSESILPNRPTEGDLLYFPLTDGLFEIKFVQHNNIFYQAGKLYVYQLEIELFQYASEKLNTGIPEIDAFESLKSFDPALNPVDTPDSLGDNTKFRDEAQDTLFNTENPFGEAK